MHFRFKALSSLLATAIVLSTFSIMVAAEPERKVVDSGNYEDDWSDDHYSWVLYSDKTLEVKCFGSNYGISLEGSNFPQEIMGNVSSIIIDLSDYEREYGNETLSIYEINCSEVDISIVGKGIKYFDSLNISNCHCDIKSFSVPEGSVFKSISINFSDFTSLDFLKDIQSGSLSLYYCNYLTSISISGKYMDIDELRSKNGFVAGDPDAAKKQSAQTAGYEERYYGESKQGLYASVGVNRCDALTSLSVSGEVSSLSVRNCQNLKIVELPSEISYRLELSGLPEITDIDLPSGTYGCSLYDLGVKSLTIPDTNRLLYLRGDSIEKVILASGIKYVDRYMFSGCSNLNSVSIPSSVTSIEYGAFNGCRGLKSIELPSSITKIDSAAFKGSGLESISIPSGVSAIEYATFKDCSSLKSVYLPSSMKSIHLEAFKNCSSLTDVYFAGNETQWNKIAVSDGGSLGAVFGNAKIHFSETIKWGNDGNKWFCLDSSGERLKGWQQIDKNDKLSKDGSWYFFDNQGIMQTGWLKSGSSWYFMGSNGAMTTGWVEDGGKSYYMNDETGKMVANAWVESGGEYYYMSGSGALATGWVNADGAWYYMNASGKMIKDDWIQSGKSWYYMGSSGAMATGWLQSGSSWFYMGPSGAMVTGWQKIGSFWYYFSPAGYMATGWQKINGSWFFMHANGNMLTGWHLINGSWFYFDEDGYMQTGFKKIDGKTYYMDPNGYMRTGWIKLEGKMYFFDASGVMFTGTHVISGTRFEFADDGHCINPPD